MHAVYVDGRREHHPQHPLHEAGIGDGDGDRENCDAEGAFRQVDH